MYPAGVAGNAAAAPAVALLVDVPSKIRIFWDTKLRNRNQLREKTSAFPSMTGSVDEIYVLLVGIDPCPHNRKRRWLRV